MIIGYEMQMSSIGYLIERATHLKVDLAKELGRVLEGETRNDPENPGAQWNFTHSSGLDIKGRIVMNCWRMMRSEIKLDIYSFENVVYHVLHRRCAKKKIRNFR